MITFRDIPEGVTVTVPTSVDSMDMAQVGDAPEDPDDDYMAAVTDTFGITLVPGLRAAPTVMAWSICRRPVRGKLYTR